MAPNIVNKADPFSFAPGFTPTASLIAVTSSNSMGTITVPEAVPRITRPMTKFFMLVLVASSMQIFLN